MSALSGITVSTNLADLFADAVQSASVRFIKVSIQNESLVHDLSLPISASFNDDLAQLQRDDVLPQHSPAYILAKLDPPSPDWITFYYVPDTAQVRQKMLYASTRLSLVKALGSSLFTDSIFATCKADLTAEAYLAHQKHIAAPQPLTAREQELADLRAAENSVASYQGSHPRASPIGTGVGLNWSPEAEQAVLQLAHRSGGNALVILEIEPKTESLVLVSVSDLSGDSLGSALPSSEPCYALYLWSPIPDSGSQIVFVYSCPSDSPVKYRMLYSSGSTTTYQAAKKLLEPQILIASRKIETSDPSELNDSYLRSEFNLDQSQSSANAAPTRFSRPKGPPRRR